jgi:hypothetical protein
VKRCKVTPPVVRVNTFILFVRVAAVGDSLSERSRIGH